MRYSYPNSKWIYRGKRIDLLTAEEELPNGTSKTREIVNHPGAVVILPMLDKETVILIRNQRFIIQQTLWELPAGTLEKAEDPAVCASRELIEETGYHATTITPLFNFFSTPGFSNELLYGYLAEDLQFVGQNLDESEKIEVEALSFDTALNMIKEGIICDAKTISLLLYFARYGKSEKR